MMKKKNHTYKSIPSMYLRKKIPRPSIARFLTKNKKSTTYASVASQHVNVL